MSGETHHPIRAALDAHLARWGLRHLTSDAAYFAWQREVLSPDDLARLHHTIDAKRRAPEQPATEIAFYDLTAQPHAVPVLYSQRYEYYCEVGALVLAQLRRASTVLDVGCGIGLLTTWYAQQMPDCTVLGLDRSPASIALARQRAEAWGLRNVRFACLDLERDALPGAYDVIVATHTVLQSEQDPGLPSRDWRTFERVVDPLQQSVFEQRTGLGPRLDRLRSHLAPGGRMLVFEKARQSARRVPLQRALAARGLHLLAEPTPVRYRSLEEVADDGPLYVLGIDPPATPLVWDEQPEPDAAPPLDLLSLRGRQGLGDEPLYENHFASAQQAWHRLPEKRVHRQVTCEGADGRGLHVEWGACGALTYLYAADRFDQRQLVVVESSRAGLLERYYQDILAGLPASSKEA